MRVLWISYYYLPHVGGGTWATYNLSLRLSKKGHKVELVVPNISHKLSIPREYSIKMERGNPSMLHRTPVFPLPREVAPFLSGFFILCTVLGLRRGADVIIAQYHPHTFFAPLAVLLGRILKTPVILRADDVFREMGSPPRLAFKTMNILNEYFIKYAKAILVVCSEEKRVLLSRHGQRDLESRIHLSFNGVDLSEFNVSESKLEIREKLGFRNDERIVLFTGRFSGEEYGIEVLIRALPMIQERVPNVLLAFVGDKLAPSQLSLVNALHGTKNIRVYGPKSRSEITRFIIVADICLGPLRPTSAIPLKVVEYMACGKPIVTGIDSLSRDIALNGYNCICVPPESEAVAEAILGLFRDKNNAKLLGLNAMRTARRFTWDKAADNLDIILCQARNNVGSQTLES